MLNRSESLSMSTSFLEDLSNNLISKDTQLVFSMYTVRDRKPEDRFYRRGAIIYQACFNLAWVPV